jgi:class 3 adenylate cyclase/tetratricopeptide (TPR) repeat protein
VVTVLFTDVAGSTALGERLDPESVRRLMGRFFAEARMIIERHGGTVEKFIGDAVMAVFGIPVLHEDDASRAVRAAVEIRDALERLNRELSAEFGVEISVRTGVNTGVVVAGAGDTLVSGDAVNTAARLEQAAAPGEILIGAQTVSLVRHVARVEQIGPLHAKGKAQPVQAYRVIEISVAAPDLRLDSAMVGREHELRVLMDAFGQAVEERRCRLSVVVGQAGIGKSRLVHELVSSVGGRARVLRGRCLSYGQGITYWPIGEMVRDIAAIADHDTAHDALVRIARLIQAEDAELLAERVGALVGLGEAASSEVEGFFAVRKLLESLARHRPQLILIEDVHWAEPTLLDLVEYLALGMNEAPVQLVCTARPELMERRPGWLTAIPHAVTIALEPFDGNDSEMLLSNLLGDGAVAIELGRRISDASGGNPLYIEEILSVLVDDGLLARHDGRWVLTGDVSTLRVPPTIQALLSARIDRLAAPERAVLDRAAVVGRIFYWRAVAELSSEAARRQVGAQLLSLARKGFIVPTQSDLPGEDAYRFRHVLIRDAAYEGVPKAIRAELHARLAQWLQGRASARAGEVDEIVGYHLEQAYRYRTELGSVDSWGFLAEQGAGYLGTAGRRALSRRDLAAATSLLERARSLLSAASPTHRQLGLELASALIEAGRFDQAKGLLEEVERAAAIAGEDLQRAHARVQLAAIAIQTDPEGAAVRARVEADAVMPIFEAANDDLGIAQAWRLRGEPDHTLARFDPFRAALEQALVHLRKASDRVTISEVLALIARSVTLGPTPIPEALARMRSIIHEAGDDHRLRARVRLGMAVLLALQGRNQEALDGEAEAEAILRDLGVEFDFGWFGLTAADLELALGRLDRAEQFLRRSDEIFERAGERSWRSTVLAVLAWTLIEQGRVDEAGRTAQLALELGASDDFATIASAQAVLGRVLASRNDPGAETAARQAVAVAEQTDVPWVQGLCWDDLAIVLLAGGRVSEAREALRHALDRFERKGATALAERVRSRQKSIDATS